MKIKTIVMVLLLIFSLISLFIYIEPSITGFAVQDRFLISNISVSAEEFNQEIKIEQFDDYEIKIDNALYYFTANVSEPQKINYIIIEFIIDNSQLKHFSKDDVSLYHYKEGWSKLDTKFLNEYGRYSNYESRGDEFGLFAVALRKGIAEIIASKISKDDLILFGLAPIFSILIFFIIFVYGFVRLLQKINYRMYLLLKKGFIGLIKFGLSLGIVILILGILSPEQSGASTKDIIYFSIIPLLILSLISYLILNSFLWIHRLVVYNKVYRFFRNSLLLFAAFSILIFGLLIKFVPKSGGIVNKTELIMYGLLPVVCTSFILILFVYGFYSLFRRVAYSIKKI